MQTSSEPKNGEEIKKTENEISVLKEKLNRLKKENEPTVEDIKKLYED